MWKKTPNKQIEYHDTKFCLFQCHDIREIPNAAVVDLIKILKTRIQNLYYQTVVTQLLCLWLTFTCLHGKRPVLITNMCMRP